MNVKDVKGAMDDLVEAHGVKPNENIYVKSTYGAELIDGFDVVETDSFTGVFVLGGGGEPAVSARVVRELESEIENLRDVLHNAYEEIRRGKNGRAIDIIEEWGESND